MQPENAKEKAIRETREWVEKQPWHSKRPKSGSKAYMPSEEGLKWYREKFGREYDASASKPNTACNPASDSDPAAA